VRVDPQSDPTQASGTPFAAHHFNEQESNPYFGTGYERRDHYKRNLPPLYSLPWTSLSMAAPPIPIR